MAITFKKIEPLKWQHAVSDKRPARRYEVLRDGVKVGEVGTYSTESWRKAGRIRTSMAGYEREWRYRVTGTHRDMSAYAYTRDQAVSTLTRVADGQSPWPDPRA